MLRASLPPGSAGLRDAHRNLGALIPTWAGAKPLPQCFSSPPPSKGRLHAFQLNKICPENPGEPTLNLAAAAAGGSVGAQPPCHVPTADAGAARPRSFGASLENISSFGLPRRAALGSPGVPAIPPPCSKPSVTRVTCKRGRAVLPFPHVPAPSWCPPLPACRSPGLHQLFSWEKNPLSFWEPSEEDGPSSPSLDNAVPEEVALAPVKFTPWPRCGSPLAPAADEQPHPPAPDSNKAAPMCVGRWRDRGETPAGADPGCSGWRRGCRCSHGPHTPATTRG